MIECLAQHRSIAEKDLKRVESTFVVGQGREDWALLGLDVSTPPDLRVIKSKLLSGRVSLELGTRATRIIVERWGLARQLIDRHPFVEWIQASSGLTGTVTEPEVGLATIVADSRFRRRRVLAKVDPVHNQIVFVRADYRDLKWEPQWDWFNN